MNIGEDQPGSLQLLKNEWSEMITQLGLTKEEDTGRFHPYGNVNFSHSQKALSSALSDLRSSLQFFAKYSDEIKTAASSSGGGGVNSSPLTPSTSHQQTSNDAKIFFKQWKDHKKTVTQKAFLNETLETCTNVLTDYCLERERLKNVTPIHGESTTVHVGGQRIVRIIQILKRIAKKENQSNYVAHLYHHHHSKKLNEHSPTQPEQNLFQFFEYASQGKQYYTIANSSYVLDVILDMNGILQSVSMRDEKQVAAKKEYYEAIEKDLYEQLIMGKYDLFEKKVMLFFQQKRVLELFPRCVATIVDGEQANSDASENNMTLKVFETFEQELWNRIRLMELEKVSSPIENVFNGHGRIDRRCEGLSMTYFASSSQSPIEFSAVLGIDEYTATSTCPFLLLQPPIEIPMFTAQQLSQYATSNVSERMVCHMTSSLPLSDALLGSIKNTMSSSSAPLPSKDSAICQNIHLSSSFSHRMTLQNDDGTSRSYVFHADQGETSPSTSNAIIMSKIPFTQLSHIPLILEALRSQTRFNYLYSECFVPSPHQQSTTNKKDTDSMMTDDDEQVDVNATTQNSLEHHVEITILPPLTIVMRIVPSDETETQSTIRSIEIEIVSSKQVKVYLFLSDMTQDKIYSEEASQHVNQNNNLPLLLNYLLTTKQPFV